VRGGISSFTAISLITYTLPFGCGFVLVCELVPDRRGKPSRNGLTALVRESPAPGNPGSNRLGLAVGRAAVDDNRFRKKASLSPIVCDCRSGAIRFAAHNLHDPFVYPFPASLTSISSSASLVEVDPPADSRSRSRSRIRRTGIGTEAPYFRTGLSFLLSFSLLPSFL
jgi:hypothetical protein